MKATTVTITHPAKLLYYLPIHKPHGKVWFTWFGIMNGLQDTEDVEEDLPKFVQEYSENAQWEGLRRILDVRD
jgi:hypothetical protein